MKTKTDIPRDSVVLEAWDSFSKSDMSTATLIQYVADYFDIDPGDVLDALQRRQGL